MTMNNNNSNVPSSTQGIVVPAHMQQRLPFMSKGLPLLSHNINRKPVRRALVELGRNDRKHNAKLANRLLTISTQEFKQKWNFDPIKMKPITEGSNGATAASIIGDGLGHKKYQWELVKQTKAQVEEYKDKKELERTVFSLVPAHTDRKQMRLSTVAVQVSQSDDTSQGKASSSELEALLPSRIPQLKEEESIVSSTTEEEPNTVSAATQSITDNGSNSQQQKQQPQSITVASNEQRTKEEELRRRLTADDASKAAASVVPTVTSATITNNTALASRQSKITGKH